MPCDMLNVNSSYIGQTNSCFCTMFVCATVMDEDEELERAMLNITPSKLRVESCKYTVITLTKCQN